MNKSAVFWTVVGAVVLGLFVGSIGGKSAASAPRAENATPVLQTVLSPEQEKELLQGEHAFLTDNYAEALPALTKYAMLGQPMAQFAVGSMYYFGKGLPSDREEGVRWLRLAAAQNLPGSEEALSAAENGSWAWDHSDSATGSAEYPSATGSSPANQDDGFREWASRVAQANGGLSLSQLQALRRQYDLMRGARSSSDNNADGSFNSEPQNRGLIDESSGQYLPTAGPGTYVDPRDGTVYARSGPNGVVNTRTEQYVPVTH